MGTTAQKLTYLNETKSQLKNTINYSGASIIDDTFRQYPRKLYTQYLDILKDTSTLFSGMPKVPQQTGTELTLDNTANTKMKLELNPSELTQETTTGANLQKFSPRTSSGTYNYVCDNKGQVTITGTVSSSTGLSYNLTSNYVSLTAGTYKMKVIGNATGVTFTANNANATIGNLDSNQEATVNVTQDISNFQIFQYLSTGVTYNCNYYITLASGNTATTERYTGGNPQPNPDYPSEVQVIKGNNSIKIENINLAWTGWAENFVNRINSSSVASKETYDNRNCLKYNANAGYSDYDNKYLFKTNWKENTQYTIICDIYSGSTSGNICFEYTDGTLTRSYNITTNSWNSLKLTSDTSKTIKYIRVYNGTSYTYIDLNTFMVYEGADNRNYVSHQEQVLPLNLPVENLIPTNTDAWEQGTISSSNGLNSASTTRVRTIDYYNIVPGNYSISIQNSTYCWLNMLYYDSNKGYITSQASATSIDGLQNAQITVPNGTKYFRATIKINNSTTILPSDINLAKPQVEKGDKVNIFTSYGTTPIEYCKMGDYEDEFEHDGDKWYINKAIGKAVFNGNVDENWTLYDNKYFRSPEVGDILATDLYCNLGKYIDFSSLSASTDNRIAPRVTSTVNQFWARFSQYSTVDTFKALLSITNMIVYYVLATPTHTEITDTTLINQLNAIEQAVSYDEQTNISQTNTRLPFRIKASAIKNLESVFE